MPIAGDSHGFQSTQWARFANATCQDIQQFHAKAVIIIQPVNATEAVASKACDAGKKIE